MARCPRHLIRRGLRRPEFLIVDGAPGLKSNCRRLTACRCRGAQYTSIATCSPLPELHEEIGADYNDMIYAATPEEIEARRKAFIRKWR